MTGSRQDENEQLPGGDIWIADVLRAWTALGAVTADDRRLVAAALGLALRDIVERKERPADPATAPSTPGASAPETEVGKKTAPDRPPDAEVALPFELKPAGTQTPRWATVKEVVPPDEPRHLLQNRPIEPLFTPEWARAAVSTLCATEVEAGTIDLEQVLAAICNRRPLAVLPRQEMPSLRRGIQLLVDDNERFSFYQQDVDAIVETFAAVAGRETTEVLRFSSNPIDGVRRQRFGAAGPWQPPSAGTPIVVVSDFGLVRGSRRGRPAPSDWEKVAAIARAAGCPLLGLVPFASGRWPVRLRRAVRLLQWDRTATAALARRVARGERA